MQYFSRTKFYSTKHMANREVHEFSLISFVGHINICALFINLSQNHCDQSVPKVQLYRLVYGVLDGMQSHLGAVQAIGELVVFKICFPKPCITLAQSILSRRQASKRAANSFLDSRRVKPCKSKNNSMVITTA